MKFRRVVTFTRKLRFESSVISYGSQTIASATQINAAFESSVIPYDSLISCCEIKRYLIVVIG